MRRSNFVILGTVIATFGLLVAGPVTAADVTLKLAHQSSKTHPFQIASEKFAEEVAKRTNGAVEVKIFGGAQLGSAKQAAEGLRLGTVDVAPAGSSVFASWVPELNVIEMPFMYRGWDHFNSVWSGPVADDINKYMAAKGFHFLGMWAAGVRHIMSKKPVFGIEDMKGIKIRAIGNPVHIATFNAFGANSTAIAYPEVYGALQTGVVDAADAANTNYFSKKFYEVAPYWAMVSWTIFSNPLAMSEKKFQSLSPSHQKAVTEAAAVASSFERALWQQSDADVLGQLQAKGVKVTLPLRQPFQDASQKVYDEFLKTDLQKNLLRKIVETK
jgi:tripartite ATP-independent transporter DctP family solute receptor